MRRVIFVMALAALACAWVPMVARELASPSATPVATSGRPAATATGAPRASPSPPPTLAPTFTPTPLPTPTPTAPPDPQLRREGVLLLPRPPVEGDRLSIDVDPVLPGLDIYQYDSADPVEIVLALPNGETFTSAASRTGLDRVPQARFYWIAALPDVADGEVSASWPITLSLSLPDGMPDANPDNNKLVIQVPIGQRESLLPPEPDTAWRVERTTGFALHYLSGSAADRDLHLLADLASSSYAAVAAQLGEPRDPVSIYLLDRVVGQGGYASSDWVAISYPDRRYSPASLPLVIRHELTHRLDDAIGCDDAPALMREGLAVYVAGGHYNPEPLREKAAALLSTTYYVPLTTLVRDFYTHQHEVGYLEAGALTAYIVEEHGLATFEQMCRTASDATGDDVARWEAATAFFDAAHENGDAGVPDGAAQGASAFEQRWHSWLRATGPQLRYEALLTYEIELMDLMRTYQRDYDIAAHYLAGVLFSPKEGEDLGVEADFVRRPRSSESVAIELVLAMAQEAVAQRDVELLGVLNGELRAALNRGHDASMLLSDVHAIVARCQNAGWEPYRLILEEADQFRVLVLNQKAWPQQSELTARFRNGVWELAGTIGSD